MRAFSAETRRSALQRMADGTLDVLVIGGGITGCGIALDAALRGLSVALVERDDFASGTSGRSSRMIHGGIRYLQQYEWGLVHESQRERAILRRLAPHLARITPMFAPVPSALQRLSWRVGMELYDALATGHNVRSSHGVSAATMGRAVPGLARPTRGFVYYECRTDDARLTLEVARAAHGFGALIANHAEVDALVGAGEVQGASVVDRMTGERLEARARVTVNATGVWADRVQALAGEASLRLRPSRGVHLMLRPGAVATRVGVIVPSAADDGRFVFVVPADGRTYAGTTDTDHEGDLEDPEATAEDRDYLLAALARAFPGVTAADVTGSWAGLRPLLGADTGSTADLSRRHRIVEHPPGLLTITGGKLTTYRAMAEDLVDAAAERLGRGAPSRTRDVPLALSGSLERALADATAVGALAGLPPEAAERLVYRFGDDWEEAVRRVREDGSLGDPVAPGLPVLRVELDLARDREMALTDQDVLVRRSRLSTLDERAGLALAG